MDRRGQLGLLSALDPVAAPKLLPDRHGREERTLRGREDTHRLIGNAFYLDAVIRTCGLGDDEMVFRGSSGRTVIAQLVYDTAPAGEINGEQRRDRPRYSLSAEGREIGGRPSASIWNSRWGRGMSLRK